MIKPVGKSSPARAEAGMGDYLKEAFLFRWNLLALIGATAAALISGHADLALPLVAAAELTYLTGLVSIPKFRAAIDAKVYTAGRSGPETAAPARVTFVQMMAGLEGEARQRFIRLRKRCLDMRGIAQGVSGRADDGGGRTDEIRVPALNRMLWVFLRLLRSKEALDRFLATTDADIIEAKLTDLRAREAKLGADGDPRLLRSITDSIATAELRLENYRRSERNAEFVDVELDRIEGKIQALSEMAINHQDPDYISSQVDSVAESVAHTEDAIREMHHITGMQEELGAAPDILDLEELEVAG